MLLPAPGALLQEGIDIAVILNALRALKGDEAGVPEPNTSLMDAAEPLRAA